MNKIEKIEKVSKLYKECKLPDGEYNGLWGGYIITIQHEFNEYRLKSEVGVRGMDYPVTVFVRNGVATFKDR